MNERFELIDYLPVNYCINWFSILGVKKPLDFQKTKILSIFDPTTWLLLLFSLTVLSILNTKYKRNQNVILTVIHSWFNHLEELISKSGKLIMISLCLSLAANNLIKKQSITSCIDSKVTLFLLYNFFVLKNKIMKLAINNK